MTVAVLVRGPVVVALRPQRMSGCATSYKGHVRFKSGAPKGPTSRMYANVGVTVLLTIRRPKRSTSC